jgi:hypothetical protein
VRYWYWYRTHRVKFAMLWYEACLSPITFIVVMCVMPDLTAQPASSSAGVLPQTIEVTATAEHHFTFHELLSELNPLQYLPVVGTIYRAVTGDTIPESAREAGSLVVSGLIGGPIGVAINLATLAIEKITGIDPEKIGHDALVHLGIGSQDTSTIAVAAPQPAAALPKPSASVSSPAPLAWSSSQLMAYGVTTTANDTLKRGALEGADVLNDMELARHSAQRAALTYAASPALPNS